MKIIKKFKSRKNEVKLIEIDNAFRIVKIYSNLMIMEKATELMGILSYGIAVPKLYEKHSNELIMEYIEGNTLLDEFMTSDFFRAMKLAEIVIDYINDLNSLGYVQSDPNFTNYIIDNGKCVGIDYDEIIISSSDYDLSDCVLDMILFAISYDNVLEEVKIAFSKKLIIFYNINKEDMSIGLTRLVLRRGKGLGQYKDILDKLF